MAPVQRNHPGPVVGYKKRAAQEGRVRPPERRSQVPVRFGPERVERAERMAMMMSTRPPYVTVNFSDLVRRGLDELLDRLEAEGAGQLERRDPCSVARAGDSSWCATCSLRWDTNDPDGPKCPSTGKVMS